MERTLQVGQERIRFRLNQIERMQRLVAGWGDWLGTGTIANFLREYRSFKEARAFVRGLGLQSGAEWSAYCKSGKKPGEFRPGQVELMQRMVGPELAIGSAAQLRTPLREFRTFKQARAFAHSLKLKSGPEWSAYTKSGKKLTDIPANPLRTYAEVGWAGMSDWLGYVKGAGEAPAPADTAPYSAGPVANRP